MNDDEIEAVLITEQVEGTIECYNPECDYYGLMTGYIEAEERKEISFVCPQCGAIERVKNLWDV